MAEVHGNRTHRGPLKPATGFEVQEAHQDLTTSRLHSNRFSFLSQGVLNQQALTQSLILHKIATTFEKG